MQVSVVQCRHITFNTNKNVHEGKLKDLFQITLYQNPACTQTRQDVKALSEAFIGHFYITHKNSQHVSFSHIFPDPVGMSHLFYVLLFWVSISKA